ncbi:MAG: hypothetical protein SOV73_10325 [Candidatus Faecivivens sp.]|nr:hypothetical protein [Candidatus Faecivivens sp.]
MMDLETPQNLPDSEVKKFRSILFKGLQVSKGQSPLLAGSTDSQSFSRLPKPSNSRSQKSFAELFQTRP